MNRSAGFTLIEITLVMLVISIGFLGLSSLFSNNSKSLSVNEGAQLVAQYAQECAEHVIAVRRDYGFSSTNISSTMCDSTVLGTLPNGFTRTVCRGTDPTGATCTSDTSATYTGTSTSACPNGITCRNVTVTVSNGTVSSIITLMLVNY